MVNNDIRAMISIHWLQSGLHRWNDLTEADKGVLLYLVDVINTASKSLDPLLASAAKRPVASSGFKAGVADLIRLLETLP